MRVAMEYVIQAEGLQVTRASSPLISILRRGEVNGFTGLLGSAEASACVPCSPQTM